MDARTPFANQGLRTSSDKLESVRRDPGHLALIEQRRDLLRAALAPILSSNPAFVWEVGCGHGHFLTAYAAVHPEATCIGIDLSLDRVGRAERKRSRARLSNLHFLQADADDFLAALPKAARISSLFILFPDPWPKRRHHKNRLLQAAFAEKTAERAGKGVALHFRTDHESYFAAAREVMGTSHSWRLSDEPWPFEIETVFQRRAAKHHSLTARRV